MDGSKVRAYRQALGWPASELARRCGMNPSVISRIEAGLVHNTSVETLCRIARALQVTPGELLRADCGAAA